MPAQNFTDANTSPVTIESLQALQNKTANFIKWYVLQRRIERMQVEKKRVNLKFTRNHNHKIDKVRDGIHKIEKFCDRLHKTNKVYISGNDVHITLQCGDVNIPVCASLSETMHELCYRYRINMVNHWFSINGKPVREDVALGEYALYDGAFITMSVRLLGGSNAPYRLYTHVYECEAQVVQDFGKFELQANFIESAEQHVATSIGEMLSSFRAGCDKKHEWILDLFESFFQTIYWFQKCESFADYTTLMALAYKLLTKKSVSTSALKVILADNEPTDELQGRFTEYLRHGRDLFNHCKGMVGENSLFTKVRKAYAYLLVQGYLSHFSKEISFEDFKRLSRSYKCDLKDSTSMAMHIFDTALSVCERLDTYLETGMWQALIHDDVTYLEWLKNADRLIGLAPFTANLKVHGTSYFAFISDLHSCIEKGDAICAYTRSIAGDAGASMKKKLDSLKLLKNIELTRRAAQQERDAPAGILLYGFSSVAKSTISKMMYYYYGKLHQLDVDDHYRYVRNPTDEYWSGFDSSKWCIQLDDIAYVLPKKASEVDPTLKEMLNVVNNVPYVPPQAALEDKGKTPVRAELVIATSNVIDLNASHYFQCPVAVQRRLPFVVEVVPKKDYIHENGKFIDPKKMTPIEDSYPDFWKFRVHRLVPTELGDRMIAKPVFDKEFTDVNQFLKRFGEYTVEHIENQAKSRKCDEVMRSIDVCRLCLLPKKACDCAQGAVAAGLAAYCVSVAWQIIANMISNFLCMGVVVWFTRFYGVRVGYRMLASLLDASIEIKLLGALASNRRTGFKVSVRQMLAFGQVILVTYVGYKLATATAKRMTRKSEEYDFEGCDYESSWYDSDGEEPKEEKTEIEPQGNVYGTVETQLAKEETQNVWYNPTVTLNTFDVPLASRSRANLTPSEIRDLFAANCVHLDLTGSEGGRMRCCGVFVCGQWLLLNNHIISRVMGDRITMQIVTMTTSQGVNSNVTYTFSRSDIKQCVAKDYVMLRVRCLPPFKDITKFWANTNVGVSKIVCVRRLSDGTVEYVEQFQAQYMDNFEITALNHSMPIYMVNSTILTKKGDCGSLGVAQTPQGPIIIGIHTLGHNYTAAYNMPLLSEIENLIGGDIVVNGGGEPQLTLHGEPALSEPHHRSMIRYLPEGTLKCYGSLLGFRAKPKSTVCPTVLSAEMQEHFGVEIAHGKPVMSGYEPWKLNLVEMIKPDTPIQEDVLRVSVDAFTADIIAELTTQHGDEWKKELVFLSHRAAVNGLPGVKFIDGLNKNSSMGHPWNTTKKRFLLPDPDEMYPEGVAFKPEVMERVERIESCYREGRRAYPVFKGHLKDEPTSLAKIAKKKTRVFTGAPVDWSLVVRSRLLSFVRLVQKNKFIFEAGPGTVCQSPEWGEIRDYLVVFGEDQIIAGDYGKFDKRMSSTFVLAAFEIIQRVHAEAGFGPEEVRELCCIAHDTAFPVTAFNGDLLEFFGTNPSGHPLTVIINSLANSLYMRYVYMVLNPQRECVSFKRNVHLFTYGDDNIMGVSPACTWFYHGAIQEQLSHIGVEYTMADKEAESVPYINLGDTSFLKRRWRWDEDVGAYTCPLEVESIHKSLTMWVPSKSIVEDEQMVAVISSANTEFFFYGKETFEKHHAFFKEILEREPYKHWVKKGTLPGWSVLRERFWKGSLKLT
jgi:hypothetical protein